MNIIDLMEGNSRFASSADPKELKELAERGQNPVATVISCSDSRVPVEVIFNQLDPGRLFVIRVAGNIIADPIVKGSIEYAVTHLKTPFLIVIGHSGCGAIKAYLSMANQGELVEILRNLELKSKNPQQAAIENIHLQVERALRIACVRDALESKSIEIYGMFYDLETGILTRVNVNGLPVNDMVSP
ncbi:MAG: carbonic anhydrase [Dehalococcoidales bacterium]|nr:carbonic anhydrase [Dehalococcoidales bacterium]